MIPYILLALVIILVSGFYFYSKKSPKLPEIVETRTFTCPLMDGYTFDYPVFKNLTDISFENFDNQCRIAIYKGAGYKIIVDSVLFGATNEPSTQVNRHNISYLVDSVNHKLTFLYIREGEVREIKVHVVSLDIFQGEYVQLMLEKYSQIILDSFRRYSNSVSEELFSLVSGETIQKIDLRITHTEILDQVKLEANGKMQIIDFRNIQRIEFQGYNIEKFVPARNSFDISLRVKKL